MSNERSKCYCTCHEMSMAERHNVSFHVCSTCEGQVCDETKAAPKEKQDWRTDFRQQFVSRESLEDIASTVTAPEIESFIKNLITLAEERGRTENLKGSRNRLLYQSAYAEGVEDGIGRAIEAVERARHNWWVYNGVEDKELVKDFYQS